MCFVRKSNIAFCHLYCNGQHKEAFCLNKHKSVQNLYERSSTSHSRCTFDAFSMSTKENIFARAEAWGESRKKLVIEFQSQSYTRLCLSILENKNLSFRARCILGTNTSEPFKAGI